MGCLLAGDMVVAKCGTLLIDEVLDKDRLVTS